MSVSIPQAVLIAGPTASGKSALALQVARRFGGVVINADSMQVYRDLRILTARPSPAEEAEAPHRLYGHVDGGEVYSVARYLADAQALLADLAGSGALPVFVGGTGLYFKALVAGLSDIPPVPEAVRRVVREAADTQSTPDLHAHLALCDPEGAARLQPGDRQRILRALEVLAATGEPIGHFTSRRSGAILDAARCVKLFLAPDRALTRARIDARFDAMVAGGALDEVRALAHRAIPDDRPVMRAHGVPGLLAFLAGHTTLDAAIERGKRDTRAYAKRQETWFRHQMPGWQAIAPAAATGYVAQALAASGAGGR